MEPYGRLIVVWAVACNRDCMNLDPAESVAYGEGGRQRLVEMAAKFGRLLDELPRELHQWDAYVDYLSLLAIAIRDGVFSGRGPATARNLMLCLLGTAGFRLKTGQAIDGPLLESIDVGDPGEVAALVKATFDPPPD